MSCQRLGIITTVYSACPLYRHITPITMLEKTSRFYKSFDRKSFVTCWHHARHTVYVWFWNTSGLFPPHRWKFATRVRNCPSQFTGTYRQAGRIEREVVHSAVSAWITVPLMKDPIPNFVVPGMVPYCVCLQIVVARNVSCCERWQLLRKHSFI